MKKIIPFILICFFITNAPASDFLKEQRLHYQRSIINSLDYKNHRDLLWIAGISLPASFLFDQTVQEFAQKHGFYADEISNIGDEFGHRKGYYATVTTMAIYDLITRKPWRKSLAEIRLVAEGLIAGQMVVDILKTLSARERPNGANLRSFPSGHSAGAFGLATTLNGIYGKTIGIPAYAMAFFVASSRIHDNKHYLSDVIAGGLVGTIVARGFVINYHKNWQITPIIRNNQLSLNLRINF